MAGMGAPTAPSGADGGSEPHSGTAVAVAIAVAAATQKPAAVAELSEPAPMELRSGTKAGPAVVVSLIPLLLGGAALWAASFTITCRFVIPLSVLGLLSALIAVALAWNGPKRRLILPIIGNTATSGVLILAVLAPSLLGPTYLRTRLGSGADPNLLRAIPIGSAPLISEVPEWIDASQYALQRGELRVQVSGVSVGQGSDAKEKSDGKGKSTKSELLLVRVRVQMPLSEQKANGAKQFDWSQSRTPTLSDSTGTSFTLRDTKVLEPADAARKSHLFPMSTTDQIFTFEAPPTGWTSLRLELPAAAWGGNGVFRFTLPTSMMLATPMGAITPPKGGN
jgi:hypothetical protein